VITFLTVLLGLLSVALTTSLALLLAIRFANETDETLLTDIHVPEWLNGGEAVEGEVFGYLWRTEGFDAAARYLDRNKRQGGE
jgi:hypothetical protein